MTKNWENFCNDFIPVQEREYSKLRESNRQLVAVAKGLAGALLVVGVSLTIAKLIKSQKNTAFRLCHSVW